MKIRIELDEAALKELVYNHIQSQLGDLVFDRKNVVIEVKSKQNWKSEWEHAEFRAVLEKF